MTGGVNSASVDTYVSVAGMSAPQPSHWIAIARPVFKTADERFRHEETHLHVLRRQHPDDRAAGRHPVAFTVERVEHAARARGQHRLLIELPRRLLERRLRGRHLRRLCFDLLFPARQLRDGELAAQLRDAGDVGRMRRTAVIQLRACDPADLELRLVARELRRALLLVRQRLRELGARDVLLRRPPPELQVRKLRLGRFHLLLGLPLRRGLVHRLERVETCVDGDFIAALDRQLIETSGNGRRYVDEFAFDVALVARRRLVRAGAEERHQRPRHEGRERGRGTPGYRNLSGIVIAQVDTRTRLKMSPVQ